MRPPGHDLVRLYRDLHQPGPGALTLEAFEKAMDANDPTIAPSMLYA